MPETTPLDLAHNTSWFGVQPGMTRAAALEILRVQPGVEIDDADDEWVTAESDDWEMDLWFTTDEEQRLWQLGLAGAGISWRGQPLDEAPLDEVLQHMEPIGPAMWTQRNALDDPMPEEDPPAPATDERLLRGGTLWLAERRLGLALHDGCVEGVIWREPRDFPRHFAGTLTEEQRALSRRPDLADILQEARPATPPPKQPFAFWSTLATVLFVASLLAVVVRGVRDTQRWTQATLIQGKIAATERVPYREFRDFVPPALQWLFPKHAPRMVDGYRLAYVDPTGQPRELLAAHGDFIVYSYEVGQEVPLSWIPGPPPEARTYYRARDFAFLEYVPWVIAFGLLYAIVRNAVAVLNALWRRRASELTPG